MAQAAITKTAIRVFFFTERRLDGREGVLLKYFTSFYDKIHVLLAYYIPHPAPNFNKKVMIAFAPEGTVLAMKLPLKISG
jgi:hypothetical protein